MGLAHCGVRHGRHTPAEKSAREDRYNGIELCVDVWFGPGNGSDDSQKFRLSADAARTLAATLIRAANIKQGLA